MASARQLTSPPLSRYKKMRDFHATPEPAPSAANESSPGQLSFVVQKHWASRLHYDFRLELNGVLLSWAVPKGPCYDPKEKRMAVHVEDHPVEYSTFEGTIPAKQYGAGTVIVWDRGTWEPVGDPEKGMNVGKVISRLHGEKLAGLWELVRISSPTTSKSNGCSLRSATSGRNRSRIMTSSKRFPTAWPRSRSASSRKGSREARGLYAKAAR
jgi:bifunctional non-homologous end joining protein LigD